MIGVMASLAMMATMALLAVIIRTVLLLPLSNPRLSFSVLGQFFNFCLKLPIFLLSST